jgi:hypothetical protein
LHLSLLADRPLQVQKARTHLVDKLHQPILLLVAQPLHNTRNVARLGRVQDKHESGEGGSFGGSVIGTVWGRGEEEGKRGGDVGPEGGRRR